MRILGVDFGFKRIGLAVGETEFEVITPRPALPASGKLAQDAVAIAEFAKREQAELLVLGKPFEEDGTEGKMARICGKLAEAIRKLGVRVEMVDERRSSREAEEDLRQTDLRASQRRKLRDGEAARILVERYLRDHAKG